MGSLHAYVDLVIAMPRVYSRLSSERTLQQHYVDMYRLRALDSLSVNTSLIVLMPQTIVIRLVNPWLDAQHAVITGALTANLLVRHSKPNQRFYCECLCAWYLHLLVAVALT